MPFVLSDYFNTWGDRARFCGTWTAILLVAAVVTSIVGNIELWSMLYGVVGAIVVLILEIPVVKLCALFGGLLLNFFVRALIYLIVAGLAGLICWVTHAYWYAPNGVLALAAMFLYLIAGFRHEGFADTRTLGTLFRSERAH